MLIAHYLFSLLRAFIGSHHPASGAGTTGTPTGQPQQPGTVVEPAAPVAQPVTTVPTETTQIGLVIEGALRTGTGATVGGQTLPAASGAAAAASGAAAGAAAASTGTAQGASAALGGLATALGHAGSAQALSVIAAQIAARQSGGAAGSLPAFDETDLAALASLAAGPETETEARALAEDSVLRHRREDWMARISAAAGQGSAGTTASATEDAAARDAAGAIFAALFGATGSSGAVQTPPQAAHRGYGQALALFG